jgi:hypothetical protein
MKYLKWPLLAFGIPLIVISIKHLVSPYTMKTSDSMRKMVFDTFLYFIFGLVGIICVLFFFKLRLNERRHKKHVDEMEKSL